LALASVRGLYRTSPGTVSLVLHYLELTRITIFPLGLKKKMRVDWLLLFWRVPNAARVNLHASFFVSSSSLFPPSSPTPWLTQERPQAFRLNIDTYYQGGSRVVQDCTPPEMLCTSAATLDRLPRFFLELVDRSLRLACLLALCRLYCTTSG
jgi:hypothetical protein